MLVISLLVQWKTYDVTVILLLLAKVCMKEQPRYSEGHYNEGS